VTIAKLYFAAIVACTVGANLIAQPVLNVTDSTRVTIAGKFLALFEDRTGSIPYEIISSPEFAGRFIPSSEDIVNFNVTRSKIWSRLTLVNHSRTRRWFIECSNPNVNLVEFYYKSVSAGIHKVSGFSVLPDERDITTQKILFAIDLPVNTPVTCYVAMWDVLPLQVNLSVGKSERMFERYEAQDFLHGAFFGLLLMLVIYNLFIYIPVRDKVYLYYVIFVIANAWFISFLTGYGIHIPFAAKVLQSHPALVPYFLGAASVVFSIVFLDMKRTYYTGYRITVFMFFLLLTVPMLDLLGMKVESIVLVQIYGLLFSIVSFVFGWVIYRRGYTSAKFYILGWTAYLIGLIVHISTDLKLIPFNAFTHNSLEIFTATEAVLLSMAVGDKINVFKKEKESAQQESLEAARENEKLVREQNLVLAKKVKERTSELEEQKKIVEEKNKEILDSINYAQRIQQTLLAHDELLARNIPEHFVLFRPKDIVSGDFYWAAEKDNSFFLAVCDSTGHGVPGAFMSLLNTSYLNEAIIERAIMSPSMVLDHVRMRLIENLSQYGGQDGMDGALIHYDRRRMKLHYSAAHNAIVTCMAGIYTEHAADKMPIGKGERDQSFTLREIELQKGMMVYVYTDGYADQFGGPNGKKFKYRQLNELLASVSHLPPEEQKTKLVSVFDSWKGALEQVDDVCIVGFRV
jgi:two-component system, sensor histidine kinase LadS